MPTRYDLETEQISLQEAKASSKRLRSAGKTITNQAILYDIVERAADLKTSKPSRKQRQEDEQAYKKSSVVTRNETNNLEVEVPNLLLDEESLAEKENPPANQPSVDDMEVWDYEQMRDDYGW